MVMVEEFDEMMLRIMPYNRQHAYEYAKKWAFSRNPLFYNFAGIGGDCTSFVSQCIYAGCCEMNYDMVNGWYYRNINNRSPSWSGVSFFYDFMTTNKKNGPFAIETDENGLEIGDVIQLQNEMGRFYHTLLVSGFEEDVYLVSAHTDDAFNRRLDTYRYRAARYLHIEGIRTDQSMVSPCFENVFLGKNLVEY